MDAVARRVLPSNLPPLSSPRSSVADTSCSPMPRKSAEDSLWSFSLRSHNVEDYSSSESEDEVGNNPQDPGPVRKLDPSSEEARLLEELDIGSRNDAATYKPNPWSIAKANAATRAPKAIPPPVKRKADASKTSRAPQRTVVDLFRQQPTKGKATRTSKPRPLPKVQSPRPSPCPQVPPPKPPDSRPSEDLHIPSDDTLVESIPLDTLFNPKIDKFAPLDIVLAPSPPHSPLMLAHSDDSDPTVLIADPLSQHATCNSTTHTSSSAESLHGPNGRAQDHTGALLGRDLRTMLFKPPASVKPSAPTSSLASASALIPSAPPVRNSGPASSIPSIPRPPQFKFKRERFSPELPPFPSQSRSYSGSPFQPIAHAHSSPIPPHAYTPVFETSVYEGHHDLHPASSPIPGTSRYCPGFLKQEPEFTPEPLPTLSRFAFHPPSRHLERRDQPRAPAPAIHHSPAAHSLQCSDSPNIRVSSIRKPRCPSLSPPPSPKQPPRTSKQPKRDAYEAFSSPEMNWSTIPEKKTRRNTNGKAGRLRHATTGPFKVPLTLGSALTGRGGKARVTTYMPPPPKNMPSEATVQPPSYPCRVSPDALDPFAYCPPPSPSRQPLEGRTSIPSPPSFRPMAIRRAPAQATSLSSYRCPTPARESQNWSYRSSETHPLHTSISSGGRHSEERWDEHPDEMTMSFDTPTLARQYNSVRQGVAEVRSPDHH